MNLALVFTIGICTTSNRFDVWAGFLFAKRPRKPARVIGSRNDGHRGAADTGWIGFCGTRSLFVRDRERPVTAQKAIGRREFLGKILAHGSCNFVKPACLISPPAACPATPAFPAKKEILPIYKRKRNTRSYSS